MRRRSTFVHDPLLDIEPRQIYVSGDRLVIEELKAAREERLTFALGELPEELWQVLRQSHELHLRWISERNYNAIPPFVSKTSPGLHVFYTPLQGQSGDLLCPLLHKVFSPTLKCKSLLATFTKTPLVSERFAAMSSFQYHSLLPSLNSLTPYIQRHLCKHSDQHCIHSASLLNVADTIDVDYDSISQTLVFKAHWSRPPSVLYDPLSGNITENAWSLHIDTSAGAQKVEVGILSNETPTDPSELSLSGFLTVVGEDDHPKPTLFSFPSRHHPMPPHQSKQQQYRVSFTHPIGLHPTMQISFPHASSATALKPPTIVPPTSICALHAYLTLPTPLFADKYQLSSPSSPLFLQSHHLTALRSISGEIDLEAPAYVLDKWGSNLLLELATPSSFFSSSFPPPSPLPPTTSSTHDENDKRGWNITVPLHSRYLSPTPQGFQSVDIPWPVIFWACTAEDGTKFPVNPFDRTDLGYEGIFGRRTVFFHLDPAEESSHLDSGGKRGQGGGGGERRLVETIKVPVLDTRVWGAGWLVEWGTVAVVLLGLGWVGWCVWVGLRGETGRGGGRGAGLGTKETARTETSGEGGDKTTKKKDGEKKKKKKQ